MNKATVNIPQADGRWGSYVSKYPADSPKVLPNMFSVGSRNLITTATGQADKRPGGTLWNPSALTAAPLDQYEAILDSGVRLLLVNDSGVLKASTGNGSFAALIGGTGFTNPANFEFATYQNRAYGCNGVDAPIVVDNVASYGGVSYTVAPAKVRNMGAQAPGSAPTATRNTDSTVNQVPAGSHTYKITFMYYNGVEESNGSAASAVCVNDGTHTSNALTAIPVGGYGVTARNIYRDDNDGAWVLLATISNNTATTYTDILVIGSTPTPIPDDNGVPPTFKYVALYLDRLFVIDVTGRNLYWSNAGEPDVFSSANAMSGPQDDVMTAVYVYNGIPWVFGQHTVGVILGTTDGTFFYSPISTTVGCVDNRSIQTRSIISTPTLMWLAATPNKGIYYTNGSTVQYLSDLIEDLTFNLAQIGYLSRQNTQNSFSAFSGGTASPSIDLASSPGTVQTINPVARYSHAADWLGGTISNLATIGDSLAVPVAFSPAVGDGALGGAAQVSGANVTLPVYGGSNVEGESFPGFATRSQPLAGVRGIAWKIVPGRNATMDSLTIWKNSTADVKVWSDVAGQPGGVLFTQTVGGAGLSTVAPGVSLTGGTAYWIGYVYPSIDYLPVGTFPSGGSVLGFNGTTWTNSWGLDGTFMYCPASQYTLAVQATAGTWTSPVYDSHCTAQSGAISLVVSASYPSGCTVSAAVQGSANGTSWTTVTTISNPSGSPTFAPASFRYWRIVYTLAATDDTIAPSITAPSLQFGTTGTWTSPAILCTTDITSLAALVANTVTPAGTSVTLTIATSTDNITYSAFVALGSATPRKWAKIKVALTASTDDSVSATMFSAELDWAVTGTLVSSAIDTGAVPSGWGVFQYARPGATGTVQAAFKTAASSGGLPAAVFANVANGAFPTNAVLEFCEWRLTMSATVDSVPQVTSVTVNWLLTSGSNARVASLFFNKSYYLSVATQGTSANNLLIELDYEGNWRIHDGAGYATMGTYFNDAFGGDASVGRIVNLFKGLTDNGTPIVFDARTKAFGPGDDQHLTMPRSFRVVGVNTGTTLHAYYSCDMGATWVEMLNSRGATGYTTTSTGTTFDEYFVANFDGAAQLSGRTIMFRVVSSDAYACSIRKMQPVWYVRKGKMISEAMA